jgi:hypothetical protein
MGAVKHHTQYMRMLDVTSRFRHALNYCDDGAPLVPRNPTSYSSSASTSHSYPVAVVPRRDWSFTVRRGT